MLFTTAIDPALIEEAIKNLEHSKLPKNEGEKKAAECWLALFWQMLRALKHSHIVLTVDAMRNKTKVLLDVMRKTDPGWHQRLETILTNPRRVVERSDRTLMPGADEYAESVAALKLAAQRYCDVVVVSEISDVLLREKMGNTPGFSQDKVVTLPQYYTGHHADRDAELWGGACMGKRTEMRAIVENWFEPFMRWTDKISIVDRYIGDSCFAAKFGKNQGRENWNSWKLSIEEICNALKGSLCTTNAGEQKCVEIVTCDGKSINDGRSFDQDKWASWCSGRACDGSSLKQGEYLAQFIYEELRCEGIELSVLLVDEGDTVNHPEAHDRWLIDDSRKRALNFSRGLDFVRGDGRSLQDCVISYVPNIGKHRTLRNVGVKWRYPRKGLI